MDQNLVLVLIDVHIVEVMEKLGQTKDFLLFNKLALSVLEMEKKSPIHVKIVMVREINKLQKKYL